MARDYDYAQPKSFTERLFVHNNATRRNELRFYDKHHNYFYGGTNEVDLKKKAGANEKVALPTFVDILQHYSLFPREEITRLLKMYVFLILYFIRLNKIVSIPYVGCLAQVPRKVPQRFRYISKYYTQKPVVENYWVLAFTSTAFSKWFLNPEFFATCDMKKIPGFYRKLFEFHKEMFHHQSSFDWNKFMPDTDNLRIALEYTLSRSNKDEVLRRLAVRSGAVPFTSSLDCK